MDMVPPTAGDASPSEASTPSGRRAWLQQALALAAGATAAPLLPREAAAQSKGTRYGGLFSQLGQQATWRSPEIRLLRRISLGITAESVARVKQRGYSAYLEEQLAWEAIPDSVCAQHLARGFADYLAMTPRDAIAMQRADNIQPITNRYQRYVAEQAILSERQLLERMVEFWTDHFHVNLWAFNGFKPFHDRVVIRPLALTTVGALVRATMRSPAMLYYLDQVWNTRWGINENYARELMELHTVGVTGGYTQRDVYELARVLTGWTVDQDGQFQYRADNHDFGAKTVFGMEFPASTPGRGTQGMGEAIAFGEHLIQHPKTREYISTKLLKWFITPEPTAAQVQAVVDAYGSEGDIKAMLRVVLSPANVQRAPAKLKRPFHLVVSAVRATGAQVRSRVNYQTDNDGIGWPLGSLGHQVGAWATPDGYPDRAEFWAGGIVDRWNATQQFAQSGSTGNGSVITNFAGFVADGTIEGVVSEINRRLFGGEISEALATELRNVLRSGVTTARLQTAVRLALMAPEFQYY
jgi:uncharacterized protein (DUF1800 family)